MRTYIARAYLGGSIIGSAQFTAYSQESAIEQATAKLGHFKRANGEKGKKIAVIGVRVL